jgi:Uma2 family endonuclease
MAAMSSQSMGTPVLLGEYTHHVDHPVVLGGLTWAGYQSMQALRGDRRRPKLAYLDGAVELMATSREREAIKSCIGAMVQVFCYERRIPWSSYGNATLDDESEHVGVEPDDCYVFDRDPKRRRQPDLAIEVVRTSGGLNKLEIYRRLHVREVWFWGADAITVYGLTPAGYQLQRESACLPGIDLAAICELAQVEPMSEATERFRVMLRS